MSAVGNFAVQDTLGAGLLSQRSGPTLIHHNLDYDTNSALFNHWTEAPEHEHLTLVTNYSKNWFELMDQIKVLDQGKKAGADEIYNLKQKEHELTVALERVKLMIAAKEQSYDQVDLASKAKRAELKTLETKQRITTDTNEGRCKIYRVSSFHSIVLLCFSHRC